VLFTLPRNMVYAALLPLMRTPRLPVVDRTDAPADLNGLVRFAERRNLVSARVPSHFNWPLLVVRVARRRTQLGSICGTVRYRLAACVALCLLLKQSLCTGLILQETLSTWVKYLVYLMLRDWWHTQACRSETRHIL